ncbi:hypothetical protein FKM82_020652, partial [Ascaphus truei]
LLVDTERPQPFISFSFIRSKQEENIFRCSFSYAADYAPRWGVCTVARCHNLTQMLSFLWIQRGPNCSSPFHLLGANKRKISSDVAYPVSN